MLDALVFGVLLAVIHQCAVYTMKEVSGKPVPAGVQWAIWGALLASGILVQWVTK